MAQYKIGSVNVTNGSATVTGVDTLWSSEISAGDIFTVVGDNAWYEVGSVGSNTSITLTSSYSGTTASGAQYAISRDFTTNKSIPYPQKGDIETASLLKRAMNIIDTELSTGFDSSNVTITGGTINGTTIGGTTAAAASVTTLTTSSTVTHNGGTANGVAYLNGSKVLTTGSALTYNGTRLTIGGVSAGVAALFIPAGDLTSDVSSGSFAVGNYGDSSSELRLSTRGFTTFRTGATDGTNGSEQMRLTSTGLGIGTSSPSFKLQVAGTVGVSEIITSTVTSGQVVKAESGGTGILYSNFANTGGTLLYGIDNSTGSAIFSGSSNYAGFIGTNGTTPLVLATNGTVRATLDSSGNLGLGVTPSAWDSGQRAFDFGITGTLKSNTATGSVVSFGNNCYYGSSSWRYKQSSQAAALYDLRDTGEHRWYYAPSGTAGNAITFTQAMTLTSGGNLLLGSTTAPTGFSRISLVGGESTGTGANSGVQFTYNSSTYGGGAITTVNAAGGGMSFYTFTGNVGSEAYTERARIDSSGNFLVGTTTSKASLLTVQGQGAFGSTGSVGNGIYLYINDALSDNSYLARNSNGTGTTTWYIGNQSITTSSDVRLKNNIRPTERNALELLGQWQIVDHTWNDPSDQCENNRNSRGVWTGVVAQQVQPITPWLVNKPSADVNEDGTINPWTMDFGYAVPLLVKAIQEQQAIINTLAARVAALESK